MTDSLKKIKNKPLSPKDIKRVLFERDATIAGLAREWDVPAWSLKAVIYRYEGVVYPEIRERLADYLGCDISQVGRNSERKQAQAA